MLENNSPQHKGIEKAYEERAWLQDINTQLHNIDDIDRWQKLIELLLAGKRDIDIDTKNENNNGEVTGIRGYRGQFVSVGMVANVLMVVFDEEGGETRLFRPDNIAAIKDLKTKEGWKR